MEFFITTFFVTAIFFLLTMFIGHEKPLDYKRGKLKTFGAWLLLVLSLAEFVLSVCMALKVQDTYHELEYSFYSFMSMLKASILMLGWAMYIFKSGPLRSKKWKRIVKSILYLLSSFTLLGASSPLRMSSVMAMVLAIVLFLIVLCVSQNQQVVFWKTVGKYVKNICVTLIMACFFYINCVPFVEENNQTGFLCIYVPWYIILFVYYTKLLWSKKAVTGEKILLLPLLQKISLFKNYSADNITMKKQLVKTVLPCILTSLCPIFAYSIDECIFEDEHIVLFLCSFTFILLLVINLVKAYSAKWLYGKNELENK